MGKVRHPVDEVASEVAGALPPGAGPVVSWMSSGMRQELRRLVSQALKAARAVSGRSHEDLEEIFEQDPTLTPLYMRVLWAAGMNGHDQTLRAMGAVLGEAVRASDGGESESVADADQALIAMSGLTPRHFRALRFLCSNPKKHSTGRVLEKGSSGWGAEGVAEAMGLTEERAAWCLSDLARTGLVGTANGGVGAVPFYWVTDLGEAVVQASDSLDRT